MQMRFKMTLSTYNTRKIPVENIISNELRIGSCFSVHYRVMEHEGSLESTKEA